MPDRLETFELEEESPGSRKVWEYDLIWNEAPRQLDEVVSEWLRAALSDHGVIAWFAFEGSFSFEHLLTPDIASQVYGIAAGEGIKLAMDGEYRASPEWQDLLVQLRDLALA